MSSLFILTKKVSGIRRKTCLNEIFIENPTDLNKSLNHLILTLISLPEKLLNNQVFKRQRCP